MKAPKPKDKTAKTKTPTDECFAAVSGIEYYEDLPANAFRMRSDGAFYIGDGVSIKPDGTFVDE
jgi:hypothetical protein